MFTHSERTKVSSCQLFWCLFSLSFILRIWGIWNVSSTDEYNEVIEALRVCSGHFNFERWVKRFYLYILSIEYSIYYVIGWIFNVFHNPMDFAVKTVRNMEPLFIIGRATSAIAGACTIGVLYKIGETFYNKKVAVVSSILLAFTLFHIDLSQQAKVDATLGLLVVSIFYFIFKILETNNANKWDYLWCGLLTALAVQTKINSIVLFVPLCLTFCFGFKNKQIILRYIFIFFLPAFIAGFIIGNPPVLFAPIKFIKGVLGLSNIYTSAVNAVPNDLIGFFAYPLYYYRNMGIVVSIFTVLAFIHAILYPNKKRVVLISFIACFYILMGASQNLVANYYMIPIVPFIYLLFGDCMSEASDKLSSTIPIFCGKSMIMLILIMLFGLIEPAINVAKHEVSLIGKNTRYIAKDWIEKNIPAGSKILMDSGKSINSFAPPIAENKKSLERILLHARENVSKGKIVHAMVDKNALIYYELLLKTAPEKSYDITSTMFGLDVKPIDYYISNQYQYLIISKSMKNSRTNEFFAKRNPEIAGFYKSLNADKRIKLIKTISPTPMNRGGTFYIYCLVPTLEHGNEKLNFYPFF